MGLELAQRLGLGSFSFRRERDGVGRSDKGPRTFITRVSNGIAEEIAIRSSGGGSIKTVYLLNAPAGDLDALLREIKKYEKEHGPLQLKSTNGKV